MNRILRYLDVYLEIYLSSLFLIAFSFLTVFQVLMRYVFDAPLGWSEELSRFAFIWFVYTSASYAVKFQRHVRFTYFINKLPLSLKGFVQLTALLFWLGFLFFLDVYSWKYTQFLYSSMQLSPANKIPMFMVYACVPLGSFMMTIRVCQHIFKSVKNWRHPSSGNNALSVD